MHTPNIPNNTSWLRKRGNIQNRAVRGLRIDGGNRRKISEHRQGETGSDGLMRGRDIGLAAENEQGNIDNRCGVAIRGADAGRTTEA